MTFILALFLLASPAYAEVADWQITELQNKIEEQNKRIEEMQKQIDQQEDQIEDTDKATGVYFLRVSPPLH